MQTSGLHFVSFGPRDNAWDQSLDHFMSQDGEVQNTECPRILDPLAQNEPPNDPKDDGWQDVLAPIATRQHLAAQSQLFIQDDAAKYCHFVVSGKLLAVRHCKNAYPAVRFLTEGDLVLLDCDDTHIASCYTVLDSQVLRIDRQRLAALAPGDPALMQMLHAVHASDLEMIL